MNGMLRDELSERADAAGSPDLDLQDLIARGERRISRRRRAVVGGTAAAVVLTVGASFALVQSGDRTTPPVGPPTSPPSTVDVPPDTTDGSEPLTYGVGATIHYGDRIIEAPEDADGLFVFDDDLAILTRDDPPRYDNRLYLLDGSDLVEIARRVVMPTGAEVGSLLAWVDGDDVVIYDISVRGVVARVPLEEEYLNGLIVREDAVYWHEHREGTTTTEGRDYPVRYDVSTGTRAPVSRAEYRAETGTIPPILVVGSAESRDPVDSFTVVDSQLRVYSSGVLASAVVSATGEPLRVSVPDGYDGELSTFQWLDDDRFAVVATGGVKGAPIGDLLLCRISAGRCHTVASGEQDWLLPAPHGGIGSES